MFIKNLRYIKTILGRTTGPSRRFVFLCRRAELEFRKPTANNSDNKPNRLSTRKIRLVSNFVQCRDYTEITRRSVRTEHRRFDLPVVFFSFYSRVTNGPQIAFFVIARLKIRRLFGRNFDKRTTVTTASCAVLFPTT